MDIPRRAISVGTKAGKNDACISLTKCPNVKRSTFFKEEVFSCARSSKFAISSTVAPLVFSTALMSFKSLHYFSLFRIMRACGLSYCHICFYPGQIIQNREGWSCGEEILANIKRGANSRNMPLHALWHSYFTCRIQPSGASMSPNCIPQRVSYSFLVTGPVSVSL